MKDSCTVDVTEDRVGARSTVWLRRHCPCALCHQPSSGQLIAPFPQDGNAFRVAHFEKCGEQVQIVWGDGHRSSYPQSWVTQRRVIGDSFLGVAEYVQRFSVRTTASIPQMDYDAVLNDKYALCQWLEHLMYGGICLIDVPKGCEQAVEQLATCISRPMPSMYGEIWDVVVKPDPVNIAYSAVDLPLHMDLVYLESPPGLQFLHCLENSPEISGGESIFLDMLLVAHQFRALYPDSFAVLAHIPVTFQKVHYQRANPVHIICRRPVFEVDAYSDEIVTCTWAPAFEGILEVSSAEEEEAFYRAYAALLSFIDQHKSQLQFRLKPGQMVTFNNRTIAHGRRAFTMSGSSSSAQRRLRGVYVNGDEFVSRLVHLRQKLNVMSRPLAPTGNRRCPALSGA